MILDFFYFFHKLISFRKKFSNPGKKNCNHGPELGSILSMVLFLIIRYEFSKIESSSG